MVDRASAGKLQKHRQEERVLDVVRERKGMREIKGGVGRGGGGGGIRCTKESHDIKRES